jgi:hypothetical protein
MITMQRLDLLNSTKRLPEDLIQLREQFIDVVINSPQTRIVDRMNFDEIPSKNGRSSSRTDNVDRDHVNELMDEQMSHRCDTSSDVRANVLVVTLIDERTIDLPSMKNN